MSLSFWHPVGPHAGEEFEEIVSRKRRDTSTHGFTLWAFAAARPERVIAWRDQLHAKKQRGCTVVCCGETTRDPLVRGKSAVWLTEYSADLLNWQRLPDVKMVSYHRGPRKSGVVASAFVVSSISTPANARVARPAAWFLANERKWFKSPLPTRGEYLVPTPDLSGAGKNVRAILHLADPFVVWVR